MVRSADESRTLHGKEFSFTGRLASLERRKAAELVERNGGCVASAPRRGTHFLVIGQAGLPIGRDGHVSRKLETARGLQRAGEAIEFLSEERFLEQLGLIEQQEDVHRLYTLAQLTRILDVPRDRLRRWVRAGVLQPTRVVHRLSYFDFSQVATAKTIWSLVQAGVAPDRIRRSLEAIRGWLPDIESAGQLALLASDRQVLVRLGDDRLADPSGQLWFAFAAPDADERDVANGDVAHRDSAPIPLRATPTTAEGWFDTGLDREERGDLDGAAGAYREALALATDDVAPEASFNLGNVLYARGDRGDAAASYLRAIELDERYVEAWNNLGTVLSELEQWDEAIAAYQRAIDVEPHYGDARYNLADTLHALGRREEAAAHWHAYLRLDPRSAWAETAKERLRE